MIGKENRARRNNLLAEHYLLATQTGKSGVVKRLVKSFGLSESYIYRLLSAHRKEFPEQWTITATSRRELDVIGEWILSQSSSRRGWIQKLMDRLF